MSQRSTSHPETPFPRLSDSLLLAVTAPKPLAKSGGWPRTGDGNRPAHPATLRLAGAASAATSEGPFGSKRGRGLAGSENLQNRRHVLYLHGVAN